MNEEPTTPDPAADVTVPLTTDQKLGMLLDLMVYRERRAGAVPATWDPFTAPPPAPGDPRTGATPGGWPYALPTDALVQWPATSQALAEKLEAAPPALGGTVQILKADATATTGTRVTFRIPFKAPPAVVLSHAAFSQGVVLQLRSVTATGFEAVAYQTDGAAYFDATASWVAVGQ